MPEKIIKIICLFKRAEGNVKIERLLKSEKREAQTKLNNVRLAQKGKRMTYREGEKIANRMLCVLKDLCHLLQILPSEEMVKSEGRVEGCGSLRK